MRTRVQRWGNSLAVRIPKAFAEEMSLADGAPVEMRLHDGGLVVEPVPATAPELADLLAGVTRSNVHRETDFGPARGQEAW